MSTLSSPTFAIHEDEDPFANPDASSSPAARQSATEEEYEADNSILTSDEALPIIEHDDENHRPAVMPSSPPAGKIKVKLIPRHVPSSRQSAVSSLPGSIYDDRDMSPYVPMKNRPIYRDGSMRMAQMASPPDSYSPSRSSSYLRDRMLTSPNSERRLLSPRSQTSHSNKTMRSSRPGTPSILQTPTREEHPLVLLHVTVLPQPWPYSTKSMGILPEHIVANQQLLEEKLNPTILARGLLLSHPGEEYDLLEERILESLELRTPRILKCGHYHRDEDESPSSSTSSLEDNVTIGRGANTYDCHVARDSSENMVFDPETHCTTCHQSIGLPGTGTGEHNRKFDIKVYAANGLMRAGAWSAAWKEMEKVDVEIGTWVPDYLRRELDQILEEEEREAIQLAQEQKPIETAEDYDCPRPTGILTPPPDGPIALPQELRSPRPSQTQVHLPMIELLRNFALVLVQDRRNLAIVLLSVLVLLISLRSGSPAAAPVAAEQEPAKSPPVSVAESTVVVSPTTVVSISTAVSFSTFTVTEFATTSTSTKTSDSDSMRLDKSTDLPSTADNLLALDTPDRQSETSPPTSTASLLRVSDTISRPM